MLWLVNFGVLGKSFIINYFEFVPDGLSDIYIRITFYWTRVALVTSWFRGVSVRMFILNQLFAFNTLKYVYLNINFIFVVLRWLNRWSSFSVGWLSEFNRFLFFLIVGAFTGIDHGVKLCDHDGALSNRTKTASGKLIHKMAVGVEILLLSLDILNGKLKLALNFTHEQVVNHDIIGWII